MGKNLSIPGITAKYTPHETLLEVINVPRKSPACGTCQALFRQMGIFELGFARSAPPPIEEELSEGTSLQRLLDSSSLGALQANPLIQRHVEWVR